MPESGRSSDAEGIKARALALFEQGQRADALEAFRRAEAAFRAVGDAGMAGEMLNNQGVILRLQGDRSAAATALAAAAEAFAAAGDRAREGQALANLGDAYAADDRREEAERCYGRAAELLAQAGDKEKQAQVLRAMSLAQLRRARIWSAMMLMERSLTARPKPGLSGRLFRWLLRFALRLFSGS
jgi:tetratricopeptide (TPR) repeat protein